MSRFLKVKLQSWQKVNQSASVLPDCKEPLCWPVSPQWNTWRIDLAAYLVSFYILAQYHRHNDMFRALLRGLTSVCLFLIEENTKDTPTAKAVKCFNVFSHDSWPDNRLELLNHGVEEVNFLLQHFSTVLDRWVFRVLSYLCWHNKLNHVDTDLLVPAILPSHARNGCSKEKAKEEFQFIKMTINTSFKDKSYLGLWQVMTTKEPYCSDFAVGSVICSIKNYMIIVTVDLVI